MRGLLKSKLSLYILYQFCYSKVFILTILPVWVQDKTPFLTSSLIFKLLVGLENEGRIADLAPLNLFYLMILSFSESAE